MAKIIFLSRDVATATKYAEAVPNLNRKTGSKHFYRVAINPRDLINIAREGFTLLFADFGVMEELNGLAGRGEDYDLLRTLPIIMIGLPMSRRYEYLKLIDTIVADDLANADVFGGKLDAFDVAAKEDLRDRPTFARLLQRFTGSKRPTVAYG